MSVLARIVGYSPRSFLFLPQQHPEGFETLWASSWYGLGWKNQIFANLQCLSFYSQPHFLSECRFDLSTSVLLQPCNEALLEMLANFMAGGHKGWSRPQKVHFAAELFKMKSLKHLFLLTVLEIYEAVKTQLRCSVVSVTVLVEFR